MAAANGNATPPKKRKLATKTDTEKPKPAKTGSRSAKTDKHNNKVADEFVISPKKLRSRTKNVVVPEIATTKSNTKSRTKKVTKQAEVAEDNNADEKVTEQQEIIENKQVVEKKARGKPATTKKAGTSKKSAATKSRAKKPQDEPTVENGDENSEKDDTGEENSVKRPPLRRGKAVDKSDVPAAASKAKSAKSRKRKNPEDANDAVAEAESAQNVEKDEETEETVANKKIRGKPKKVETETSDARKPPLKLSRLRSILNVL